MSEWCQCPPTQCHGKGINECRWQVMGYRPEATVAPPQSPALVTALRGLLASLQRDPTEFELRAAAHEFTVMADRAAAAARAGGDDA